MDSCVIIIIIIIYRLLLFKVKKRYFDSNKYVELW